MTSGTGTPQQASAGEETMKQRRGLSFKVLSQRQLQVLFAVLMLCKSTHEVCEQLDQNVCKTGSRLTLEVWPEKSPQQAKP